jgi:hypothetical protein
MQSERSEPKDKQENRANTLLRAISERLLHAMVVRLERFELEPFCGRLSPQAKS